MVQVEHAPFEIAAARHVAEGVHHFVEHPVLISSKAQIVLGQPALCRPAVVVLTILQEDVQFEALPRIGVIDDFTRETGRSVGELLKDNPVTVGYEIITGTVPHGFEAAEPDGPVGTVTKGGGRTVAGHCGDIEFYGWRILNGGVLASLCSRQRKVGEGLETGYRDILRNGVKGRQTRGIAGGVEEWLSVGGRELEQQSDKQETCRHHTENWGTTRPGTLRTPGLNANVAKLRHVTFSSWFWSNH